MGSNREATVSKTSKNSMSEDELLSALGFSAAPEPKESKGASAPSVIDGEVLIDILAPESKPARRSRASSERERAREEQEREKSLRSKEWKRELEQQQMRAAALAEEQAAAERAAAEKAAARSNSQPLIPNSNDMRDIEDIAVIANEKRRAADEVERRRLAMQEQVRRRQEEVAAEAKAAAEQARRRAEEQEASRRMQQDDRLRRPSSSQPFAQRVSNETPRRQRPYGEQGAVSGQPQRNSQPLGPSAQQGRPMAQGGRSSSQPLRPSASQPSRSGQIMPRGPRQVESPVRQRPQGFSQDLSSQPVAQQNVPVQQAPVMPSVPPEPYQAPAQQPERVERKRPKKERAQRPDEDRVAPQGKESPLGVVLIVLAVLCVLVAASPLTGLWDISNL